MKKNRTQSAQTCPICRVKSYYVIPSEIFANGDQKKTIEENYKKN